MARSRGRPLDVEGQVHPRYGATTGSRTHLAHPVKAIRYAARANTRGVVARRASHARVAELCAVGPAHRCNDYLVKRATHSTCAVRRATQYCIIEGRIDKSDILDPRYVR